MVPVGVPVVAQQKQILLGTMRLQVRSLASLSGLRIWRCRELWCRPAAVAQIQPLAWEPPYAMAVALKSKKKKNQKTKWCLTSSPECHAVDKHQIWACLPQY